MAETVINTKLIFPNDFTLKENPAYDDVLMIYDASTGTVKQVKMEKVISTSAANIIGAAIATDTPKGTELVGQSYRVGNDTDSAVTFTNFLDKDGNPLVLQPKAGGLFTKNANGWAFVPEVKTPLDSTLEIEQTNLAALDAAAGAFLNNKLDTNTIIPNEEFIDVTPTLTIVNQKIFMLDGHTASNAGYHAFIKYPVQEGRTYIINAAMLGSSSTDSNGSAVWGYDALGNPVTALDDKGLPMGMLMSNWRSNVETGKSYPPSGGGLNYTNYTIFIPVGSGIRYMSGCSYFSSVEIKLQAEDFANGTPVNQVVPKLAEDVSAVQSQFDYYKDQELSIVADGKVVNALNGTLNVLVGVSGMHNEPLVVRNSSDEEVYIQISGLVTTNDSLNHRGFMGLDADGNFVSTLDAKGRPIGEVWTYARYLDLPASKRPPYTSSSGGTSLTFDGIIIKIPTEVWQIVGTGYTDQTLSAGLLKICPLKIGFKNTFTNIGQEVENLKENGTTSGGLNAQLLMEDDVAERIFSLQRNPGDHSASRSQFGFVWISDTHTGGGLNGAENAAEIAKFLKRADIQGISTVKYLIDTGDNTNGYPGRAKQATIDEATTLRDIKVGMGLPGIWVNGNHCRNINPDGDVVGVTGATTNYLTDSEAFDLFVQPMASINPDLNTVPGKMYSYMDDVDNKIRLFSLDRYEAPVIEDGNGTGVIRYTAYTEYGQWFSQAQLEWFYNGLLNTPIDYTVVVAVHGPLNSEVDFGRALQGHDLLFQIINAFKTSGIFNHNYAHPTFSDMNTSLVFDFSGRANGLFSAFFAGHIHQHYHAWDDVFGNQRIITIPCTKTASSGNAFWSKGWGQFRSLTNPANKNAAAFIFIDTYEKKIKKIMYGAFHDMLGNIDSRTVILDY